MKLWSVNRRMLREDFKNSRKLDTEAMKLFAKKKPDENIGVITKNGDFIFANCDLSYGFFPKEGGWKDPYQNITKDMTARDVAKLWERQWGGKIVEEGMKTIKDKEIAEFIGKSPASVAYIKKNNPSEYEVLKLGAMCKNAGVTAEVLDVLINILYIIKKGDKNEKD